MPFFPYLGEALDFRTRLFDEGNEHSAINTASSALSTIVTFLCQTPFGKDTLVCRLLKGISCEDLSKVTWPENNSDADPSVRTKNLNTDIVGY